MRRVLQILIALGLGLALGLGQSACGSFQDPDIVVDVRVLAMEADLPEQVLDIDLANPPTAGDLLAQVMPSTMCALVTDPYNARRLKWAMTLCPLSGDERCNTGDPQALLASGFEDDPDLTQPEPTMCATVKPDADLLAVVMNTLDGDQLHGLAGIDYEIALRVGGEGGDPNLDLYASKSLRISARFPAQRTANTNPSLSEWDATPFDADDNPTTPTPLALGRCVDQPSPLVVAPHAKLRFTPVEPDGVRETYVVPTTDGMVATFTESLTYAWTATYGSFSSGSTGGPRDISGNAAPLFTDWTAPRAEDLADPTQPTDVALWVVQRDERLGAHWYESCVRVVP